MGFGLMTYSDTAPPLDESRDDNRLLHTQKFYEFFEQRRLAFVATTAFQRKMIVFVVVSIILLGVIYGR